MPVLLFVKKDRQVFLFKFKEVTTMKLKSIVFTCGTLMLITSCSKEVVWQKNASKIEIHGINLEAVYLKENYYTLEYIKKDFEGIDIRYKLNEIDEYVTTYYRHVTFVLTIIAEQ